MRCVECDCHKEILGTHFCISKKRRKDVRISKEDVVKDLPCEYAEKKKEVENNVDE